MELMTASDAYLDARGREHYVTFDGMRKCYWHTTFDANLGQLRLSNRCANVELAVANLMRMVTRYQWKRVND